MKRLWHAWVELLSHREPATSLARFRIAVALVIAPTEAAVRWVYDRRAVPDSAFATILRQFDQFLLSAAAAPTAPLAHVELLSTGERKLILQDWNATQTDYPRSATIHELFEAQAARTRSGGRVA